MLGRRALPCLAFLAACLVTFVSAPVSAVPIGGSAITPSTTLASSGAGFTIDEIADGITSDASPFNGFAAVPGQVGTIRLGLDAAYSLSSFVLWNDINVFQEGIKDFRLEFFDAGASFISSTPVLTAPISSLAPTTFPFPTVHSVARVDLVVLTLHPSTCCGPRLEIREVAFNGELPTPARSSTWGRIKSLYR